MSRVNCLHCRRRPQSAPRGLCWPCWEDRTIRYGYPAHTRVHGALRPPCRHCQVKPAGRCKKGLCWGCWEQHRHEYESATRSGRRGVGLTASGAEPTPTREPPGSPGKLAALAARAERGERLFHAADAGYG